MAEDITGLYRIIKNNQLIWVHQRGRESNRYTMTSPEFKGVWTFPQRLSDLEKIEHPVLLLDNPKIPETEKEFIRSYLEEVVENFG